MLSRLPQENRFVIQGAMEQLEKFLEALRTADKAREILAQAKPESEENTISAYAQVARAMGFSLSEKEIADGIRARAEQQKAGTAKAQEAVQALDLDDLEAVAGGKSDHEECLDTFKNKENCWYNDGCDHIFNAYDDYICKRSSKKD